MTDTTALDTAALRRALALVEQADEPLLGTEQEAIADLIYGDLYSREWDLALGALKGDVTACIALIERELPGCFWSVSGASDASSDAWIGRHESHERHWRIDVRAAPSACLALLIALLRAKLAEAEREGAA